jgi:hypothetical protein
MDTRLTEKDSNSQSTCKNPSQPPSPIVNIGEPEFEKFGNFIAFKQVRLQGQANPLRPPIHVETVLIGRALGQPTGYRSGVGFRIRDDGYVEAEFSDGVRKYNSFAEFELDIATRVTASRPDC